MLIPSRRVDGRCRAWAGAGHGRIATVSLLVSLMATWPVLAGSVPSRAATSSGQLRPELVYVASADNGPVKAYSATSAGRVTPVLEVDNPHNPNTVWDPWGVAFDAAGNLYVQSFLSNATTFVFAPHADAGDPPTRIFSVYGPDSRSIAVDEHGYEYVLSGDASPAVIAVAAPGASGKPRNQYFVTPVRTFSTDEAGFSPWPDLLSRGSGNTLVAGIIRPRNAVETYAGGAGGSPSPLRVISGRHTSLGSCASSCDQVSVTFSQLTGRIYAAVSAGASRAHVSVFDATAHGDAPPLRTIQGSHTGLDGKSITGIAVSQQTGDIYVMVGSSLFGGPGLIEVFGRTAQGDAAPLRAFTDGSTNFVNAMGIGIIAG